MKHFTITLLVIAAMIFTLTGCDKKATVDKLEQLATELRIHNRNIAVTANTFHSEQRMTDSMHLRILTAADKFSQSLDMADSAIRAAKTASSGERKTMLDYAERLLDVEVFGTFISVVEAVTDVPPDVRERLEQVLNMIRITFAAIRSLLADAGAAVRQEGLVHAE